MLSFLVISRYKLINSLSLLVNGCQEHFSHRNDKSICGPCLQPYSRVILGKKKLETTGKKKSHYFKSE